MICISMRSEQGNYVGDIWLNKPCQVQIDENGIVLDNFKIHLCLKDGTSETTHFEFINY